METNTETNCCDEPKYLSESMTVEMMGVGLKDAKDENDYKRRLAEIAAFANRELERLAGVTEDEQTATAAE